MYSPAPITSTVKNIYDVKAWLCDYQVTFQHHSHPHAFRFKLNEDGHVEMSYRKWAKSARKERLPEEGPVIVLTDIPPGKPAVLKPDRQKRATVKTMKDSVQNLQIIMSTSEGEWWENMVREEEKKVEQWNSLSKEDYHLAGESFDLFEFKYTIPKEEQVDEDAEYKKRNEKYLNLLAKKENHQPVSPNKTS